MTRSTPDGFAESSGARRVRPAVFEQRRADDDFARADRAELQRALGCADAAAHLAGQPRADVANDASFEPVPMAASRSMTLTRGNFENRSIQ